MASQAQTTNDIMDAKLSVPQMAKKRRTTTKYKAESYQEFADFWTILAVIIDADTCKTIFFVNRVSQFISSSFYIR